MKQNTIDEEIINCFMQLDEAQKKSVLAMIKTILHKRSNLVVNQNIDDYNNDIDEAMNEVERGAFYSHEQIVSMAKNW